MSDDVRSSAILSEDERYRYLLSRWWGRGPKAVFVMLNPSTADAEINDPTIVRCMGFARRWGYAGIEVANLYAFRATKPQALWTARSIGINIVGSSNDNFLRVVAREAVEAGSPLVAAWGANAEPRRVDEVLALPHFGSLQCMGLTQAGMPRHPLYLSNESSLQPFRRAA